MSWFSYAIKRSLVSVFILLGASVLIFSIVRLVPGDPAKIILGQFITEGSLEALRRQMGLHLPAWKQYLVWMRDVLTFDWGNSLINDKSIKDLVFTRLPRSIELAFLAVLIAVTISFPLGIRGAIHRNTTSDYVALIFSQLGISIPGFWLGILLILLFGGHLDVLPPSGYAAFSEGTITHYQHAIMPALSLGIINAAIFTRYLRSEILEELGKDYVRTARAFGHPESRVIWKYVLRNALIPTITIIGIQFGYLIGGIVIIEKVFQYPGLGQLVLNGLLTRDYPVIQLGLLVLATTFIVVNLIVDLLYGFLNPKIRY